MRVSLLRSTLVPILAVLALAGGRPAPGAAQDSEQVYFQAVSEHFHVPLDEIRVLASWGRPAADIPVVLFVAARGGVSPDAVMALRNAGRGWVEIASRWNLDAGIFHVPIDASVDAGPLARVYEAYRSTPGSGWGTIDLREDEIVGLVHLRFLTEYLGVPAARVLAALGRTGPGPGALQALRADGMP